ncbi:MAG: carbon-nitrogen hydrolase family protein [Rhabdochlamydiaceae bacterium]|nr:carbon-nitrogen hydrolase family protein [Rhabdochlamydiaceae bacterium]
MNELPLKAQIRVAAYQAAPKPILDARKEQIHNALQKADAEKIDFICFPEGFLTGYYAQESLARKTSLEVQGNIFKDFLLEISQYRVTIIIGFNEVADNDIFDSVAIIENGNLLGIQRKHYLYHDYYTPGVTFSCLQSKGVSFGVIVCLDSNYFEPARLLAIQGATILFCPMCNKVPLQHPYAKRPPYYSHFVARSHENRLWLVAADWVWSDDGEMVCPGHSVIYDPDGQEIARSNEGEEQFVVIDIPLDRLFYEKGRRIHGSPILAQEMARSV